MARSTICLGFALCLGLAACIADDPTPTEPDIIAKGAGGGECPIWECGSNSPVINNYGFHELNQNGIPIKGFHITTFKRYGVTYLPEVRNGRLYGRLGANPSALSGMALKDAQLTIAHPSGLYYLRIKSVNSAVHFWAAPPDGATHYLESYELEWQLVGTTRWTNVCDHAGLTSPDPVGMDTFHTLLFEGDKIDPLTRTVTNGPLDTFTLGCAGSAPAKLALLGHTRSAGIASFATYPWQRQAVLRMVSGAYSGGVPMTVAHQPLEYIIAIPQVTYTRTPNSGPPMSIEARWNETGAICLGDARVNVHPTDASNDVFPGGITDSTFTVAGVVKPPPCSDVGGTDVNNFAGAYIVSANPP